MFFSLFPLITLLVSYFCGPVRSVPAKPSNYCGIAESTDAVVTEFPWMAQLIYKTDDSFPCAGTLINERFVLTTAQCAERDDLIGVRLGKRTTNRYCDHYTNICSPPPLRDFQIDNIFVHHEYNRETFDNDIALIKLTTNVNARGHRTPLCLPVWKHLDADYALSTGWGVTEDGTNLTHLLLQSLVPIKHVSYCRRIYDHPVYPMKQICAGGKGGNRTCNGGTGGPLMIMNFTEEGTPQFIQFGILSYGQCQRKNQPRIYIRVAFYMDWILDNIRFY